MKRTWIKAHKSTFTYRKRGGGGGTYKRKETVGGHWRKTK